MSSVTTSSNASSTSQSDSTVTNSPNSTTTVSVAAISTTNVITSTPGTIPTNVTISSSITSTSSSSETSNNNNNNPSSSSSSDPSSSTLSPSKPSSCSSSTNVASTVKPESIGVSSSSCLSPPPPLKLLSVNYGDGLSIEAANGSSGHRTVTGTDVKITSQTTSSTPQPSSSSSSSTQSSTPAASVPISCSSTNSFSQSVTPVSTSQVTTKPTTPLPLTASVTNVSSSVVSSNLIETKECEQGKEVLEDSDAVSKQSALTTPNNITSSLFPAGHLSEITTKDDLERNIFAKSSTSRLPSSGMPNLLTTMSSAVSSSGDASPGPGLRPQTKSSPEDNLSVSSGHVTMSSSNQGGMDQLVGQSPSLSPSSHSKQTQGIDASSLSSSSNEALSSSTNNSSPMKRAVSTSSSGNPNQGSSVENDPANSDTHGTPAKRTKKTSSSSSIKSTNGNESNNGSLTTATQPFPIPSSSSSATTTSPVYAASANPVFSSLPVSSSAPSFTNVAAALASSSCFGVKDTINNQNSNNTSTNSVVASTTSSCTEGGISGGNLQSKTMAPQSLASGHENITDSEEDDDEGKMMIDEDASSDREVSSRSTNSPGLHLKNTPLTVPPVVISTSMITGIINDGTKSATILGKDSQSSSFSQQNVGSKSPSDPSESQHSNTSSKPNPLPASSTTSPKVPPIRIVISKSTASSSPSVTAVQSTSSSIDGQKVSSSTASTTNLNSESISSSSSNSSQSQSSNVSSTNLTTGSECAEGITGTGIRNQVSSSSLPHQSSSSSKEIIISSNKDSNDGKGGDESESDDDDGSENGSLGSAPGSFTGGNNSSIKSSSSKSIGDKVDGDKSSSSIAGSKTRSSKEQSGSSKDSTSAGGRVTRSSQRVAAREKDGSHSEGGGGRSSGSTRESSHRLRERRKGDKDNHNLNEYKDSPASQDNDGDNNHSMVSPTSSSKDGSNETGEVPRAGGPGRKRKTRQGLRGKDGAGDRGTPEKVSSKRVRELIKEDSNQGSNQGDEVEDNDSTSSSTSSNGNVNHEQLSNANGLSNVPSNNGTGDVNGSTNGNPLEGSCVPPTSFQMPSYNSYQMYLNIRKQVEKRRKTLVPVTPKAPTGFKNYLLNRGNYLLHGKVAASSSITNNANLNTTSVLGHNNNENNYGFISCNSNNTSYKLPIKLTPPTSLVPGSPLYNLFLQQENDRQKVRIQHTIEREKLRLSVEQEVLRVHGRAALAMANQSVPLSVCSILKDEEIYNTIEPIDGDGHSSPGHGTSEDGARTNDYSKSFSNLGVNASHGADLSALTGAPPAPGSRLRYNGRILVQWLADVSDKWDKIKSETLKRQRRESESLVAIQKLDWEWKMKELKLCDFKSTPIIHPSLIPSVDVTDDFHLLPSN